MQARVVEVVRAIPAGRVMGYGEVARRAGFAGRARQVARILADSEEVDLPWHRVLRSSGHIAFPPGTPLFDEQLRRLRAEGVMLRDGRVQSARMVRATLDEMLWGA